MRIALIAVLLALITAPPLSADDAAEQSAIRGRVASYLEAFNRGDAQGVAAHWSERAVYISRTTGERMEGRPAIEAAFRESFAGESGVRLEVEVESIRLITPDVAIEDGTARFESASAPPESSTYTAVHVKRDGTWFIDSLRETNLPGPATHFGHLQDLSWMIGEWVDAGDGSSVHTTCAWTKNNNFITRSFRVAIGDQIDLEGTQVIGWDPAAETIRSWMFDSDGGYAEGIWTRDGDRWVVQSTQRLPDGGLASAVNILTPIDGDRFRWQSTSRVVNEQPLDDIGPVTVVRKQLQTGARPIERR